MNVLFKFFNYIFLLLLLKFVKQKLFFTAKFNMSLIIPFATTFTLLLISYRNQCICFQNGFFRFFIIGPYFWDFLFRTLCKSNLHYSLGQADFVSNFLKMNKLFVHFLLQNRWNKSDVLHNIKCSLYLMVTPKALFAIFF